MKTQAVRFGPVWAASGLFALLVLAQGCATPTKTRSLSDALPRPGARVVMKSVTNRSGRTFDTDVSAELRAAMVKQLEARRLLASEPPAKGDLRLDLGITEFRPGSAFKRWALPGWGATVLGINGTLQELEGNTSVAQIEHKRTVAAGGFYTIGAEHYIFNDVARDLVHDLEVRISKGGDFLVPALSRGDSIAAKIPEPDARTIWIEELKDNRDEKGRIGERTAAFGVSMGDVYFARSVSAFLRENLELELTAAGCRLDKTNATVSVAGDVKKFWLHTKTTPLYWDVIAEMELDLQTSGQTPSLRQDYVAQATKRTYVWPTSSLCAEVVNACLENLMAQIRADDWWH